MPGGPDGTPRPPQTGRAEALRDASFLPFCSKLKTIVCTWLCFSRRNNGRINPDSYGWCLWERKTKARPLEVLFKAGGPWEGEH